MGKETGDCNQSPYPYELAAHFPSPGFCRFFSLLSLLSVVGRGLVSCVPYVFSGLIFDGLSLSLLLSLLLSLCLFSPTLSFVFVVAVRNLQDESFVKEDWMLSQRFFYKRDQV